MCEDNAEIPSETAPAGPGDGSLTVFEAAPQATAAGAGRQAGRVPASLVGCRNSPGWLVATSGQPPCGPMRAAERLPWRWGAGRRTAVLTHVGLATLGVCL